MDVDRDLLGLYLNDHLAGAAAGRARARQMARQHADLPVGSGLHRLSSDLSAEHARLRRLVDELGLEQRRARRALAKLGERLGRLKLNGHLLTRSPMTPLLEVELMRGAVNAKRGLWQTVQDHAADLGLDRQEWADLDQQAQEQSQLLDELHGLLRPGAFSDQRDR